MRSFYQVNAILKSNQKTDPVVLAHECVRAAATIPQVLQQVLKQPDSTSSADVEDLKVVLTACSRAIMSLTMAFNRLSNVADGSQVQGRVTYAYVAMYTKLIEVLTQTSKLEATKVVAASGDENNKPTTKSKKKQAPNSATIRSNPTLQAISIFLCSIIDNLNPKLEAHHQLFEGFAFAVLEKLGSCLYILTFGRQRAETLKKEIAAANEVDEIEDGNNEKPEEAIMKSSKLEAPYLVQLLNRIMTAAPAHLGSLTSAKAGKAKAANASGSMKGATAIGVKNKLQRTLINCMFGTEGLDGASPLLVSPSSTSYSHIHDTDQPFQNAGLSKETNHQRCCYSDA